MYTTNDETLKNIQLYHMVTNRLKHEAILFRFPWKIGIVGESLTSGWQGWLRGYRNADHGSVWYFDQGPEYFKPGDPVFYHGA